MQPNMNRFLGVALLFAACLAAPSGHAANDAAGAKPSMVSQCAECGKVYSIRRVEKPTAPGRDTMPGTSVAPTPGGIGNEVRAVPQISIGRGGAQRVEREPATRSVWELTVRYDNGQFGLVTLDSQPNFAVGDRVRRIDNTFVPIPQPAR